MAKNYKRIVLASRPRGWCSEDNFKLEEAPIPQLQDGEVLVRNDYMSLDPYMRGRMNDVKSYAAPQNLHETMQGGTVGEVARRADSSATVASAWSLVRPSTSAAGDKTAAKKPGAAPAAGAAR